MYIENNGSFNSGDNQKSWFFNLALGFLPGSIVMIVYQVYAVRWGRQGGQSLPLDCWRMVISGIALAFGGSYFPA